MGFLHPTLILRMNYQRMASPLLAPGCRGWAPLPKTKIKVGEEDNSRQTGLEWVHSESPAGELSQVIGMGTL